MKLANYQAAQEALDGGEEQTLDRSTVLHQRHGGTIVLIHDGIDLITFPVRGPIRFDTRGNLTTSVRNRINKYSPINITSQAGVWVVSVEGMPSRIYADGMTYDPETRTTAGHLSLALQNNIRQEREAALEYARSLVHRLRNQQLPAPGAPGEAGDLLYGVTVEKEGRRLLLGEALPDKTVLKEHIRFARFFPALLGRAVETADENVRPVLMRLTDSYWTPESPHPKPGRYDDVWEDLLRQVRKYLFRELSLVQ